MLMITISSISVQSECVGITCETIMSKTFWRGTGYLPIEREIKKAKTGSITSIMPSIVYFDFLFIVKNIR